MTVWRNSRFGGHWISVLYLNRFYFSDIESLAFCGIEPLAFCVNDVMGNLLVYFCWHMRVNVRSAKIVTECLGKGANILQLSNKWKK